MINMRELQSRQLRNQVFRIVVSVPFLQVASTHTGVLMTIKAFTFVNTSARFTFVEVNKGATPEIRYG